MCDENVQHGVPLRCLELFSGVGGFHYALKESVAHFEVLLAFDINDVVNAVYAHNFPGTTIRQCNIQSLKADFYDNQNADLWTMSPPCQPFTKKGAQRDVADRRCDALKSICSALQRMRRPPRFICVENVCGFETSSAHAMLVEVLTELEYELQEFILSPADLAIPNSRPRYYLLAKRNPGSSLVGMSGFISRKLPDCATSTNHLPHYIGEFVCDECDRDTRLRLDERMAARYAKGIDMVTRKSTRSSCFTKSYSLLISSSGPVLVCAPEYQMENPKTDELIKRLSEANNIDERIAIVSPLRLRYFSWREMANLMGFPSSFSKPQHITQKQMYRALGNSVNVKVVAALLRHLLV
ncbi:tRNA (cytosine-5-)-methyltransferase [Toxocara canis]|uniref:tRNA (cytosine(38)-C(5))-methyltransferase n=2 Tax=Toxocara canis TaxID=6265 RepID=A0A0B2VGV3_TOXCA|nr:tRNA (cytosine-5-)-methyltransferase [Toxocara canis]VDM36941.1 unnamed protein product [Toxocara canis]